MSPDEFKQLALTLPEASEQAHMGHPDFRVGGKIFATLGYPDDRYGVVGLKPQEQASFVAARPKVFQPVQGGWGSKGATLVRLSAASKTAVWPALVTAWRNRAPAKLIEQFDAE